MKQLAYFNSSQQFLLEQMKDISSVVQLNLREWDLLLRLARQSQTWPLIASQVSRLGLNDSVPEPVRWHVESQCRLTSENQLQMQNELQRLNLLFEELQSDCILLKGAAYLWTESLAAEGRISGDIDLLVREVDLQASEQALNQKGWQKKELGILDDRYFRKWLREVPPLRHEYRHSEIDLHHHILHKTDPIQFNSELLFADASVPRSGGCLKVLAPVDMFIHSASHLFRMGDFEKGLRDLHDLKTIFVSHNQDETFAENVMERATEMGLAFPCRIALRYLKIFFDVPLSNQIVEAGKVSLVERSLQRFYDRYVPRALFPSVADRPDPLRKKAIWILSHYPPPRLSVMLSPLFWTKRVPFQTHRGRQL